MNADKVQDMRSEYTKKDLGEGLCGKYYENFSAGTNLVLLSPDVAKVFKDEKSVNDALRALVKIARESVEAETRSEEKGKGRREKECKL